MTEFNFGSRNDDVINTDDDNQFVLTGRGNDTVNTGAGNDIILAGRGDDEVNAGDGNDLVFGGKGDDSVNGGFGSDLVFGGRGDDVLIHELVDDADTCDVYMGGRGRDTLRLLMSTAQVALYTDQIAAFEQWNLTAKSWQFFTFDFGGSKLKVSSVENLEIQIDDVIGDVEVVTGSKEDGPVSAGDSQSEEAQVIIFQGDADATLEGGSANDILTADEGNDTIDGGAGDDNIDGGAGDDNLEGGAGGDTLTGGDGNDKVDGGEGDDTIVAASGQGNDFYDGGSGTDTVKFSSSTAINDLTIDMREVDRGGQTVNGVSVAALLAGFGQPTDRQVGLAFDSANPTQIGVDVLVNLENVIGGDGNDTIYGNFKNNELRGGDGNDALYGVGGDNFLDGGAGDDLLQLSYGAYVLRGGTGVDRFFMQSNIFEDRILDFELGIDILDLSRSQVTDMSQVTTDFSQDVDGDGNNDAILNYSPSIGAQRLVIDNMTEADWISLNDNYTGSKIIYASPSQHYEGTAGNDEVAIDGLGTGRDSILAGAGDDVIRVSGGDYVLQGSGDDTIDYSDTFANYSTLDYSLRWDGNYFAFDQGIVANINVTEIGIINNSVDATVTKTGYGTDTLLDLDLAVSGTSDGFEFRGTNLLNQGDQITVNIPANGWINVVPMMGSDTINFLGNSTGRISYENDQLGIPYEITYGGAGTGGRAIFDANGLQATIIGVNTNDLLQTWTDTITAQVSLEFAGGQGDDTFLGADNFTERFIGSAGNNYIDGGAGGQDRVRYDRGNATDGITADLELVGANVTTNWDGNVYQDTLVGIESIRGSNFADTILMSAADERVEGRSGDDTIDGRAGNDQLLGQNGDDNITGGIGDDKLDGGSGNDVLDGGDGWDELDGGSNDDTLTGGLNGDTFIFSSAFGNDTVTDFTSGDDLIDVSASGTQFADWDTSGDGFVTEADANVSLASGSLVLDISGNTATLTGVTQLVEADFIF